MTLQRTIDLPSPPAVSLMVRSLKGLWPQHVPAVAQTTTVVGGGRVLMTDGSSISEVTPTSPHSCPTQISLTYDLISGSDSRLGTSGGLPYSTYYTHREE